MVKALSAAGRAFIRALIAGLITYGIGIAEAPGLSSKVLVGVAAIVGAFVAGLRVIQAYLPKLALATYLGHPYGDWADSFLQAFVGTLIVTLPGVLGAPNLSATGSLVVGVITGALAAGVRAVQGVLTKGEHPVPDTGINDPPNHYSYVLPPAPPEA